MKDIIINKYEVDAYNSKFKVEVDNKNNFVTIQGIYTKDDDLHSLVLRYRYNIDMEPEMHILSDGNKVLADSKEGKMLYENEEFTLETPKDKEFATKLLLYENHELLEKILEQVDTFFITNELKKEVKDSTNTQGIKEYIAMKHDPRMQEILKGYK